MWTHNTLWLIIPASTLHIYHNNTNNNKTFIKVEPGNNRLSTTVTSCIRCLIAVFLYSQSCYKYRLHYRIAGNFRGRKPSRIGRFLRRKLARIAHFCRSKGRHASKFRGENFANSHKTAKFAKLFSLEIFPLYAVSLLLFPQSCSLYTLYFAGGIET